MERWKFCLLSASLKSYLALNKTWEVQKTKKGKRSTLTSLNRECSRKKEVDQIKVLLMLRGLRALPSFMERASNLRGKSEEVPPVAAEPWMSGKALRRPVLAEDAKLVTTDSTSVMVDGSVLIATSTNRMNTYRRRWVFSESNVHHRGRKAQLDQKYKGLEDLSTAFTFSYVYHFGPGASICWIEQEVLCRSQITINISRAEWATWSIRVQ